MNPRLDWTRDAKGQGWLCVAETTTGYSAPERLTAWWPVLPCSDYDARNWHGAPREVRDNGTGTFRTVGSDAKLVMLRDGGTTKPIRTDREPIPRPRAREVRWRNGRWEKFLTRKGWVLA